VYEPVATELGPADRHPWHGDVGSLSFGQVAGATGVSAAAFAVAGAECGVVLQQAGAARDRTAANARGRPVQMGALWEVDPAAVPFMHILVGTPD
jgi:hypothetical protein